MVVPPAASPKRARVSKTQTAPLSYPTASASPSSTPAHASAYALPTPVRTSFPSLDATGLCGCLKSHTRTAPSSPAVAIRFLSVWCVATACTAPRAAPATVTTGRSPVNPPLVARCVSHALSRASAPTVTNPSFPAKHAMAVTQNSCARALAHTARREIFEPSVAEPVFHTTTVPASSPETNTPSASVASALTPALVVAETTVPSQLATSTAPVHSRPVS
mmetsp:Transcript_2614/g.10065  ORF Transcript_2614/g.10065 Transcript_2614/m.10065 type:complete len:220 (-) Transcript_2614:98-757(-)